MYLHLRVTHLDHAGRPIETVVLDKEEGWVAEHVVQPRSRGDAMFVGGREIAWGEVQRIRVSATEMPSAALIPGIQARDAEYDLATGISEEWQVADQGRDVTEDFIVGLPGERGAERRPVDDPSSVMVVYGQDEEARRALFDWLRCIGLRPQEWPELVKRTKRGSPFIGDVLDQAFQETQAVVVLFTPDERVQLRDGLAEAANRPRLQARPNVFLEAGMAFATDPDRTVMVVLGDQEIPSDLAGRHYVRIADERSLRDLANRLTAAGCPVELGGTDWLDLSRFPTRDGLKVESVDADASQNDRQPVYAEFLSAHARLLDVYSGLASTETAVREARQTFTDAHTRIVLQGSSKVRNAAEALWVAWTPRVRGLYMGPNDSWRQEVENARGAFVRAVTEAA